MCGCIPRFRPYCQRRHQKYEGGLTIEQNNDECNPVVKDWTVHHRVPVRVPDQISVVASFPLITRFMLGLMNGLIAVAKTLISEVCGKEHEVVGMTFVTGDRSKSDPANRKLTGTTTLQAHVTHGGQNDKIRIVQNSQSQEVSLQRERDYCEGRGEEIKIILTCSRQTRSMISLYR